MKHKFKVDQKYKWFKDSQCPIYGFTVLKIENDRLLLDWTSGSPIPGKSWYYITDEGLHLNFILDLSEKKKVFKEELKKILNEK